nr:unnamed protein product [Digitaria exilis]
MLAWPPSVRPRRCRCHVQCRRSYTMPRSPARGRRGVVLAEELGHGGLCLTARGKRKRRRCVELPAGFAVTSAMSADTPPLSMSKGCSGPR